MPPFTAFEGLQSRVTEEFRKEVDRFGIEAVWNASIRAVGFPFTWDPTDEQAKKIKQELEKLETMSHGD